MSAATYVAKYRLGRSAVMYLCNRVNDPEVHMTIAGNIYTMSQPRKYRNLLIAATILCPAAALMYYNYSKRNVVKTVASETSNFHVQGNLYGTTQTQLEMGVS